MFHFSILILFNSSFYLQFVDNSLPHLAPSSFFFTNLSTSSLAAWFSAICILDFFFYLILWPVDLRVEEFIEAKWMLRTVHTHQVNLEAWNEGLH